MLTPPLPVVLPLLAAALIAGTHSVMPRWLAFLLATGASVAVGCIAVAMIVYSRDAGIVVYWFGDWMPRGGRAMGIDFAIDNTGAMLVLLASTLVTMAIVFAFRYFDTAGAFFQVLMLIFLAALSGFSLTGDLFNLFVFFELMSATGFALCGYKSEEPAPLQGALNFAVTNTIGAVLVLTGIALLYGRTGALNLAQIGRTLSAGRADMLAMAAFAFIACGFLVKAAVAPFHFWLADAHSVAPAPVCVLFSGVMVEMGLYAVARIYWTVFSGVLAPYQDDLRHLLAAFGVATALVGAVMCYAQRHLKRLLAFSTIGHVGIMLLGVALWTPSALAGVGLYVMGHAMVKGSLFLSAGILLHRTASVDEIELHGRGRSLRWLGGLFVAGGVGLAGLPPFATFWGGVLVDGAGSRLGYGWIPWLAFFTEAVTAAAVFRFAAHVFLGWGPPHDAAIASGARVREKPDTASGHGHTPFSMYATATTLAVLGALTGLAPRLTGAAQSAALYLEDRVGYAQRVLDLLTPYPPTVHDTPASAQDMAHTFAALAAALLLAWATVCSARVRRFVSHPPRILHHAMQALRSVHSGILPDYVAWLVFGVALFGGVTYYWILWHPAFPADLR